MSKYLITGVAGFIGSNLADHIIQKGHQVVGIDNFLTGKQENIHSFKNKFDFTEGDIRNLELMTDLCNGVDYVLHHAALASVPWSMTDPLLCHEHNVTGTLNVLLAAKKSNVKKVVMAVTSAAYGNIETLPSVETQKTQALSPYASSKLMGEEYLSLFNNVYGLATVGLRYFNVFGQRQDPESAYAAAIPIFVKKALMGQPPLIFGDGTQTRDFVFIEDVIQANLKACEAKQEANGQIFNIGTGQSVSVNFLCDHILHLLGCDFKAKHGDIRQGDALHSLANIEKATNVLNYKPQFSVLSGLEKSIEWYKKNLQ